MIAERVKELPGKILERWNKFSTKKKAVIVSSGTGIVLVFAILISVLTQPRYSLLLKCDSMMEVSQVTELLDGANLNYQVSDDGYQIKINKNQQSEANLLLGVNNIQSYAYAIDGVVDGNFTTTEADKQKKYELYLETQLTNDIMGEFASVKSAVVDLYIPERNGTLIPLEKESSIWILLELNGEFTTENAASLAKAVSVGIGNKTTENVVIMDVEGNILFSGDDSYSAEGTVSADLVK